jgi:Periplasmic protease
MFSDMKEKGIKNLIIDLRFNGGSSSRLRDMLLSYLTDKPFRQYSRVDVKISKQYRNRKLWGDWPEDGSVVKYDTAEFIEPRPDPLRFREDVYVLTSKYTFSSATDFATAVKNFGIGTIIGEETGGLPTCYGDNIYLTLPNSGIRCTVSCKYFVRPSGVDDGRGVISDYEVKPLSEDLITGKDRVLELTLDLIREGDE